MFHMLKFLALYLQSQGHLNVKKGGFNAPVHLVFHFFQRKLGIYIKIYQRIILTLW